MKKSPARPKLPLKKRKIRTLDDAHAEKARGGNAKELEPTQSWNLTKTLTTH